MKRACAQKARRAFFNAIDQAVNAEKFQPGAGHHDRARGDCLPRIVDEDGRRQQTYAGLELASREIKPRAPDLQQIGTKRLK
jgi:hypothetical protein